MSGNDPFSGLVSYDFEYQNGKIVKVYVNDYFDSIFEIFYDENGLMQYMIQYEQGANQRVLNIHKFHYE